jgi:hypothetical protein
MAVLCPPRTMLEDERSIEKEEKKNRRRREDKR